MSSSRVLFGPPGLLKEYVEQCVRGESTESPRYRVHVAAVWQTNTSLQTTAIRKICRTIGTIRRVSESSFREPASQTHILLLTPCHIG